MSMRCVFSSASFYYSAGSQPAGRFTAADEAWGAIYREVSISLFQPERQAFPFGNRFVWQTTDAGVSSRADPVHTSEQWRGATGLLPAGLNVHRLGAPTKRSSGAQLHGGQPAGARSALQIGSGSRRGHNKGCPITVCIWPREVNARIHSTWRSSSTR